MKVLQDVRMAAKQLQTDAVNPFAGRLHADPRVAGYYSHAAAKYDDLIQTAREVLEAEEVLAKRQLAHALGGGADCVGSEPMAMLDGLGFSEPTWMLDDAVVSTNIHGAATRAVYEDLIEKQKKFFDDLSVDVSSLQENSRTKFLLEDLDADVLREIDREAKKIFSNSKPLKATLNVKLVGKHGVLGRQFGLEVANGNVAIGGLASACESVGFRPSQDLLAEIAQYESQVKTLIRSNDPNVAMANFDGWTWPAYNLEMQRRYAHVLDSVQAAAKAKGHDPDDILR